MPMYRKINKDFFKKWSPEMAYVLGFFAADGNMIKSKRGNHYISFHNTDRDILLLIRAKMQSDHKLAVHKRSGISTMHWNTSYQLQIGSKEIFNDLLRLGMRPRKSLVMTFPKVLNKYLRDFIRGYFDGDGHVSSNTYRRSDTKSRNLKTVISSGFTSGSKEFIEKLKEILRERGGINGGCVANFSRAWRLVYSTNDTKILYTYLYHPDINFCIKSKKEKYTAILRNFP